MPQEQETSRFIPQPPYGPPRRNVPPPPNAAAPGMPMPGVPQGPIMPPPQGRRARTWRERVMGRYGMGMHTTLQRGELTMPEWLVGKPVAFFLIAMFACWMAFGYVPEWDLVIASCLSVLLFFYGGKSISQKGKYIRETSFFKLIFIAGFVVRVLWAFYCYFVFNPEHYNTTYGDSADVSWYIPFGQGISEWIANGFDVSFSQLRTRWNAAIDDVGYPIWLGFIYLFTGNISDVFIPFIAKSVLGAFCAIPIYRVAKRHFGEGVARLAAIFVCLNPNMIYWCGTMMKEIELVFLCCVAIDNFDRVLSSGQHYTFKNLLPGMLTGLALMFFRTVLGLVFFLAFFAHIVMASRRVMSLGKKILAGVLVGAVLMVAMGNRIRMQSKQLMEVVQSDTQKNNMEWRGNSNSFAKYAGAAVFAPLIFTIPFPTFNQANAVQLTQMQLSGGSFIKNILSFFVILVMILLLASGEWRKHVFIIAYTVGYHMVLVMSAFAQSGRFHMPVIPMLMLFAAYGVHIAKGNKRLQMGFNMVLLLEALVCLAWNWFKLAGRGMV